MLCKVTHRCSTCFGTWFQPIAGVLGWLGCNSFWKHIVPMTFYIHWQCDYAFKTMSCCYPSTADEAWYWTKHILYSGWLYIPSRSIIVFREMFIDCSCKDNTLPLLCVSFFCQYRLSKWRRPENRAKNFFSWFTQTLRTVFTCSWHSVLILKFNCALIKRILNFPLPKLANVWTLLHR